jgi:hypothetical protein
MKLICSQLEQKPLTFRNPATCISAYRITCASILLLILSMLTACGTETTGPRLVAQNPVEASATAAATETEALPTLIELATEEISASPFPTSQVTSERLSPANIVTVEADFVIVTPTLPPSKTPSQTPTQTTTPTISPTPTFPVTATATSFFFPTPLFTPTFAIVSNPVSELCLTQWQYIQPPPQGCPIFPATVGQGVFQTFERGYMFWVAPNEIYVLYSDGQTPYWTRFDDTFAEGTGQFPNPPWKDPSIDPTAPQGLYQPVRGFGKLWRNEEQNPQKAVVRVRVGWGTMEFEKPYSVTKQVRTDGTIFLNDPNGRFFQLTPAGAWQIYAGLSSPFTGSVPATPLPGGASLPLP